MYVRCFELSSKMVVCGDATDSCGDYGGGGGGGSSGVILVLFCNKDSMGEGLNSLLVEMIDQRQTNFTCAPPLTQTTQR